MVSSMITENYRCPRGSDLDNPTLTLFCLDEAAIETGNRDRDVVLERLRRYGSTPTEVRKFFYGHFSECGSCRDFYVKALPSARATIEALVADP